MNRSYTIPILIEDVPKQCRVELLDLPQQEVISVLFDEERAPGEHAIAFDPDEVEGGLDAGMYIVRITVGDVSESFPLKYMP